MDTFINICTYLYEKAPVFQDLRCRHEHGAVPNWQKKVTDEGKSVTVRRVL